MKGFTFFRNTHPEAENDIFAARTETLQDAEVSTIARRSKTHPYVGGWFVEQADLKKHCKRVREATARKEAPELFKRLEAE